MSISGQLFINIGLQNESANSDSLYVAFNKIDDNFNTLFTNASPFTNFVSTDSNLSISTAGNVVSFTNTGVTAIVAGSGIGINQSNGAVTISVIGDGNGNIIAGVTSVGLQSTDFDTPLLVSGTNPVVSAGNLIINFDNSGVTPGTYSYPSLTVDRFGRITSASNGLATGTVTSVGISPGAGIAVSNSPVTTSGVINVINTGVVRLIAGTGISLSSPNGNVTISTTASGGSVTSIGIASSQLVVTGSPITTSGVISVNLPTNITIAGNVISGNIITSGSANITGNITGGNLLINSFANVVGNLVSGNIQTNGNANVLGNISANYYFGNGSLLTGVVTGLANAIENGNSNVIVTANSNIYVSVGGNSNVVTFTDTGVEIGGGSGGNITGADLISANVFSASGNITANYFIGNGLENGNSNIIITSNSNIAISVAGNSNIATFTDVGVTVGNGSGGSIIGANLISANTLSAIANVITSDLEITGNITGNLLPSANITYDLGSSSQRWNDIWLANSTIHIGNAQISANATSVTITNPQGGETILTGLSSELDVTTLSATGNITGGNLSTGGLITATGNITGGNISTSGLMTVTGNATVGNISTSGLITATGNITGGNVISLGNIVMSSGNLNYTPVYGAWYSNVTQTSAGNVITNVSINNTTANSGISVTGGNLWTINKTGFFNIQVSYQVTKLDAGTDFFESWLVINGNDLDWTNTRLRLNEADEYQIFALNYVQSFNSGDTFQFRWFSLDPDVQLLALPAQTGPTRPGVPSVIITVVPVGA